MARLTLGYKFFHDEFIHDVKGKVYWSLAFEFPAFLNISLQALT